MPQANCPKCGGLGWIIVEKEAVSGAQRCDCERADRAQRCEENAAIPPLYQNAGLDNFKAEVKGNPKLDGEMKGVMVKVRGFVNNFPHTGKRGLLFIGETGTGKTHLAVAAFRAVLNKGFEGLFFDYQNLLDRIRASYVESSGASDREAYKSALDTEVMLLDDLGSHRAKDFVEDVVTAIITHRCNNKMALIATTNLPDPEAGGKLVERDSNLPQKTFAKETLADRIGPRARSRLFEMCTVIHMPQIEDYRLRRLGEAMANEPRKSIFG
jgi:DNA replication protein DnaC